MLTKFSTWWLRRKNVKLTNDLVSELLPLIWINYSSSRPPDWFPTKDLYKTVGTEWTELYDLTLTFGNKVLLGVPAGSQLALSDGEKYYKKCVRQWAEKGLIDEDRYTAVEAIWRFLRWRFPKAFLQSDGLKIYQLRKATGLFRVSRETIGDFLSYEAAVTALKKQANDSGEEIYWGRPAVDVLAMYTLKSEREADFVEKTPENLLAIWRDVKEPKKFDSTVTAYFESQAIASYKAEKHSWFDIFLTVQHPARDSLSNDRLLDYKDTIVDRITLTREEREIVEGFLDGYIDFNPDVFAILVSQVDQLETFV